MNGLRSNFTHHVRFRIPFKASLELYNNGFTGAVPSELGLLTKLTKLALNGNELSGLIPAALGGLTALGKSHY